MKGATKPGIRDRAALALRVFRDGLPWRPSPPELKKAPFIWPAWRTGRPQWQFEGYENYVNEGFEGNSLIYTAIMYKVRAKWLAPLKAYTGDIESPEPVKEDHPLAQIVKRPNPYMGQKTFEGLNLVYAHLAGDCYIWMIRPDGPGGKEPPEEMYTLRPDRVSIVPMPGGKKGLLGYWYTPEGVSVNEGIPIPYADCMHVKLPRGGDPLEGLGEGMSPITPAAKSADVDNSATSFLKEFFERGLMPNVVLSFDVPVDERDIDEIRSRWAEMYGGRDGWLKPGVLGQGGAVQALGHTFDELGFGTLDERNETRILGPFGVPAVLIGARVGLQHATFSNVVGLRRAFWEDTFVPELQLFQDDYQYYLQADDAWVAYDLSKVPALQEDTPALVEAAHRMWTMGTPADQAYAAVGLTVEPIPGGDESYIPVAMVPAGKAGEMPIMPPGVPKPEAEEPEEAEPEREGEDMPEAGEDERDEGKFWRERAEQAKAPESEPPVVPPHPGYTEEEKRLMLAAITAEKKLALEEKRTYDWRNVELAWEEIMGEQTEIVLCGLAGAEGWSPEQMGKEVESLPTKAHNPIMFHVTCPLCGHFGADRYDDHGGLCVCQGCGKTFDPAVEL